VPIHEGVQEERRQTTIRVRLCPAQKQSHADDRRGLRLTAEGVKSVLVGPLRWDVLFVMGNYRLSHRLDFHRSQNPLQLAEDRRAIDE
jgi:hypothetical protein